MSAFVATGGLFASSSITGNNLGAGAIGLQTVTRTSTSLTGQSLGPGADNTYTVTRSSASILGAFSDPSTFSTVSRISSSLDGCISTDSNTCELQYDSLGITDTAIGIKLDPAVTIVSITADDTSLDSEFSDGDTITIIFSDDTNRPPVAVDGVMELELGDVAVDVLEEIVLLLSVVGKVSGATVLALGEEDVVVDELTMVSVPGNAVDGPAMAGAFVAAVGDVAVDVLEETVLLLSVVGIASGATVVAVGDVLVTLVESIRRVGNTS